MSDPKKEQAQEARIKKLESENETLSKLVKVATKDITLLKHEINRLKTRVNTNESNIKHFSSKR